MSLTKTNLVEIDRMKIIDMGGSHYILLPKILRREFETKSGDEVLFLRSPNSLDIILRIEKTQ